MKVFLLLFVLSLNVLAGEQYLLKATGDVDDVEGKLYIITDQGLVADKIKIQYNDGDSPDVHSTQGLKKGIVLMERDGHDVVKMQSHDFLDDRGGYFKIDYLYNGITGSRKSIEVKAQIVNNKWAVFRNGVKVNRMHFVSKKILGKAIGISKVIFK